ncbi:MAG: hypothetical protein JST19_10815 [Bacteroidetes bacterium]|nr:hypothetical protein [Bacteroidota bacterium]
MKQIVIMLLLAFFLRFSASAQEYVIDTKLLISTEANQAVRMTAEETHNHYLGKISDNVEDLNTNVGSVVLAQNMIYNALANVNSALKNGLEVKHMATVSSDMISYLDQAIQLAKSDPYLLLAASDIAKEMKVRALGLVTEVSNYVLKSGNNVLADYNSRDQLLKKVSNTLQILDGLAYGTWRAMFWAKQRGIFYTLNPWQDFINKDRLFVDRIISNAKYLRKQ